jgi:hypothetical protein
MGGLSQRRVLSGNQEIAPRQQVAMLARFNICATLMVTGKCAPTGGPNKDLF